MTLFKREEKFLKETWCFNKMDGHVVNVILKVDSENLDLLKKSKAHLHISTNLENKGANQWAN